MAQGIMAESNPDKSVLYEISVTRYEEAQANRLFNWKTLFLLASEVLSSIAKPTYKYQSKDSIINKPLVRPLSGSTVSIVFIRSVRLTQKVGT